MELRRLPDTELEVMQAIWSCSEPVYRADIEKILYEKHPMAQTTLLTILSRLSEKGFIKIEKDGRRNCYAPCVAQKDYIAAQSSRFFNKLCGGKVSVFANALCSAGLSREELEELRGLIGGDEK